MRTNPQPGSNAESVRRDNLSAVLREVHLSGARSRSELVASNGLNRSTVGGIVTELTELELVREEPGDSQGSPGRPSPWVHPRPDGAVVLAVGIAVHSLAVAVVGLGGEVHAMERHRFVRSRPSLEEALADMRAIGRELLERSGLRDRLVGVGVAAQGAVRSLDGFVHFAPNLGWSTVPLSHLVEERLGLEVPVVVRNEADLGARAEHVRGAGAGFTDLIYLSSDVGVGGGIITSGRPLVGASGYAGEIGHVPVDPDGAVCGCGSRGCWETVVGLRAFLRAAGRDPDAGPDEVGSIVRAAEEGEAEATAALADVGRWLGIGLAGLVNIFDPQVIVLGGLFSETAALTLPMVRQQLEERKLAHTREWVEVVTSRLGADAPVLGAAERAFEPLLADPAGRSPVAPGSNPSAQTGAAM